MDQSPRSEVNVTVAIASSGLGYIKRGNESWALTAAETLRQAGVSITLLGSRRGLNPRCPYVAITNWRREHLLTRRILNWHWRYLLEQVSFEFALRRHLGPHRYNIIHVADPILAERLSRAAKRFAFRLIYKDGLSLGPSWCSKFEFVQVLAPYYLEQAEAKGYDTSGWFVIPHIADTVRFKPLEDPALIKSKRLEKHVPPDAFLVMAVGDLGPGSNKRLDWILQEVALLDDDNVFCVIAGQATSREFERFRIIAERLLGGRVQVHRNLSMNQLAEWYQLADVFSHAALREPFGIVLLEAMASGLPVVGHIFPVTKWIIGDGGLTTDMTVPGQLAHGLRTLRADPALRLRLGEQARLRAINTFGPEKVIGLYKELYQHVIAH